MGTIKVKKDGEWVKLPNYGIEEFPDAPSDGKTYGRKDKQWSEIIASNQYLDLMTLFPNESGTLSDEDYQKVVDAWENKVYLVQIDNVYTSMSIEKNKSGTYYITINVTMPIISGISVSGMHVTINPDKTYTTSSNYIDLDNVGTGTKYLSDNGEYKEINVSSGALSQETQTAILNAINAIEVSTSKDTVTTQEYNSIYNLIKDTLTDGTYYKISYDTITQDDISTTGSTMPIISAYILHSEGNIAILSIHTFYEMYYTIMGQPAVGQIQISINNDLSFSYRNTYGLPVVSEDVRIIKKMTQSAYDGLASKDNNTLYIITE